MFIGRAGDVFGVSLDKIKHVWYNEEIRVFYSRTFIFWEGLRMIGVIACVAVSVVTVIICCKMELDMVGPTALTGFLLIIGFVLAMIPGFIVDSYYETKSKSDEVLHRIEWIEKYQDTENGVRDELLYEDIRKINDEIRVGKGECKNIWYGVFIDDKYLELEEIPMPEWLSPYPN